MNTNFHYLPVFAQKITTVMSHPILQFSLSNPKVTHRCTAEDARIALSRRVLGQGVSVAASRQFVRFLSLRSQGLGVGLEFTVPWVATYMVGMKHAVSLLGWHDVHSPQTQQLRLLRLIMLVIMIVVYV